MPAEPVWSTSTTSASVIRPSKVTLTLFRGAGGRTGADDDPSHASPTRIAVSIGACADVRRPRAPFLMRRGGSEQSPFLRAIPEFHRKALMAEDSWHHVVLVYDGADKIIYIDDARICSRALSGEEVTGPDRRDSQAVSERLCRCRCRRCDRTDARVTSVRPTNLRADGRGRSNHVLPCPRLVLTRPPATAHRH